MKAIVYTQYGPPDVLHLQEVEKPAPAANEILVKVHATPVNYGDLIARNFGNTPMNEFNMPAPLYFPARLAFGWSKPKKPILGSEFAGVVEATGASVTCFQPGDAVFGYRGQSMGAYAEYLCIAADGMVAPMPVTLSFAEAAAVPYGGLTALTLLRKVAIQPGQKVLINGASGGIGAAAVQLAKHDGAEVTGVCSTPRVAYVKALGADKVIDYTREDFTRTGERYDLIFDILGRSSFARCKQSLTAHGIYLLASFKMKAVMQMLWTSMAGDKKVVCALSNEQPADLVFLKELIEAGQYESIVDRTFPLEQAADAHRYVEDGRKQGNVVIVQCQAKLAVL
ncbi:MAG: NAD(P)-dependent alcohol dehydrogenase [Caldilinea sp.]|uniref:NAD(P)-dependent alcohol dehydrogenase n=1 Tax=Caldilinea sp. TaxID=2293560 RepID=UPI002C228529|nr:NAD(P)-dependent alcohol dehydrogenase [Anaerolineales bacterium]HQY93635.1 NAD(P)-dependent alcohol dehydrogenase [Caldilinea sp.]